MIRDPRAVFDQLFGVGATPEERAARRREDQSILDWITASVNRLKPSSAPPTARAWPTISTTCARSSGASRRSRRYNTSGEQRELPAAPVGVPDSFDEHVKLMFDLQALAFASDITRVFAFKMARDASSRVYPESGVTTGFHTASHHGEREERIIEFAKINKYHVSLLPYFLEKLKNTPDGDGTLLDNTLIIYGSPMGNSERAQPQALPAVPRRPRRRHS